MQVSERTLFSEKLIGSPAKFTLEARVFHSVCLILMCGIGLNIPFNYFLGLPDLALMMVAALVTATVVYYISRRLRLVKSAMAIFMFCCNIVLAINYFYNSGLNGPTYAIFLLCLLFTIAVIPRRQYVIWLPLNLLCMGALFVYDYSHDHWVQFTYTNRASRFIDFGYTYLAIAGLVVFVTVYLRNAYHAERRIAEQRASELARANEVKNKLLSVIAHDLKEPLTSIQGFLELLDDEEMGQMQRRELEDELLSRTRSASQLLNNVLSWTKSQMEGLSSNKSRITVQEILVPVFAVLKPLANKKAISLISLVPDGCMIVADPDMLEIVLRNLLTNAIKFSEPGGDVRLSAMNSDQHCVISVKDEGKGIPKEQQHRLFSLDAIPMRGTRQEKGSGLGLYLCRELMERQGGTIAFTSEVGRGSTFLISLPA